MGNSLAIDQQIFEEGRVAFLSGLDIIMNPYFEDYEHGSWLCGWRAAHFDDCVQDDSWGEGNQW